MRYSFIAATLAAFVSVAYKAFGKEFDGEAFGKSVIKTGGFLVILGFAGLIPFLATVADVIAYIFVTIVILNDGYDLITAIGAI